jgi:hypothetical protein
MSDTAVETAAEPKARKQVQTAYKVLSLPTLREKLSPQLRALVNSIDELQVAGEGDNAGLMIVKRAEVFNSWAKAVDSEDGEKVFASYIHQLISFAFIERLGDSGGVARKILSPEERKAKLMNMIAKLSESDRAELLNSVK